MPLSLPHYSTNPSCPTQSAHSLPYSSFPAPPTRPHPSSSSRNTLSTSFFKTSSTILPFASPPSSPMALVMSSPAKPPFFAFPSAAVSAAPSRPSPLNALTPSPRP